MAENPEQSIGKKVIVGTIWTVSMRWSVRLVGLVSAAFLARLLMPEDFGLVAIALIFSGLAGVLFDFGVDMALIQNNKATDDDFNTAWSIRLCQSLAIVALLLVGAPYAAGFYNEPRIENIIYLAALGIFVQGFENIGVVKFRKDLTFSRDFKFNVIRKVGGALVTVALAFYLRSYMALVLGTLATNFTSLIASYIMSPFRPKFSFSAFARIWSFSQWVLIGNLGRYLAGHGDKILHYR